MVPGSQPASPSQRSSKRCRTMETSMQPTEGDPSNTGPCKVSRISCLTTDRRRPQRYKPMENVEDFTLYNGQKAMGNVEDFTPYSPQTIQNTIKRPNKYCILVVSLERGAFFRWVSMENVAYSVHQLRASSENFPYSAHQP